MTTRGSQNGQVWSFSGYYTADSHTDVGQNQLYNNGEIGLASPFLPPSVSDSTRSSTLTLAFQMSPVDGVEVLIGLAPLRVVICGARVAPQGGFDHEGRVVRGRDDQGHDVEGCGTEIRLKMG